MKRRLLVSYLSITAFVLLVLGIPLGVSYANSVERRLDERPPARRVRRSRIRSQEPLDHGDATDAGARARRRSSTGTARDAGGRVVIVDADGRQRRRLRRAGSAGGRELLDPARDRARPSRARR